MEMETSVVKIPFKNLLFLLTFIDSNKLYSLKNFLKSNKLKAPFSTTQEHLTTVVSLSVGRSVGQSTCISVRSP